MDLIEILFRHGKRSGVKFVNRGSLVLGLILLIDICIVTAVTRPRELLESRLEAVGSRYCDFAGTDRIYNITDLLQCMNELASTAVSHTRMGRSSKDRGFPISSSKRSQSYSPYPSSNYQYPQRPSADYPSYYDRRPVKYYSGSQNYQGGQSGYYDEGLKYPYPGEQPFGSSGGVGSGLFDALASISQYDDLKCVPRLLCEVATGVIPGNSGYKQSYDSGNSLISLLTALDIGESSPLLQFGKSALTGYTSRGNPSICYREYPKCPRSNADLINYLNNHNGGFFRFFGNMRGPSSQGNYYRGALRREPALPPGISGPETDRTGTGELKFDSSAGLEPLEGQQTLNRVSKSLMSYQNSANDYQSPSYFPQDRKDQESNMLFASSPSNQASNGPRLSRTMGSTKAKLYLPDDTTNETMSTFTFPDGQKVRINVAFSKLFSENYRKALRRSFSNDHSPQPVNFEGFSMVNLAELYPNDRGRLDLQVVHPCDMVCHDSKGTPVQFNQILLHSGSLSTLMTPDQPIIDLSNSVPCEIMCIDRRGERRQLSMNLNQVLRTGYGHQPSTDMMAFQDHWMNRDYRSLNQQSRHLKSRKVRENIKQLKNRGMQNEPETSETRDTAEIRNRMAFFGSQIPFVSMQDLAQGNPTFISPGSPGSLGMPISPIPLQTDSGIMQALGMMPMFPGMIPMIDPLAGGIFSMIPHAQSPPLFCSGPTCPGGSNSPEKILMMCGSILYLIPSQAIGILPICAISLDCESSTDSGSIPVHHESRTEKPLSIDVVESGEEPKSSPSPGQNDHVSTQLITEGVENGQNGHVPTQLITEGVENGQNGHVPTQLITEGVENGQNGHVPTQLITEGVENGQNHHVPTQLITEGVENGQNGHVPTQLITEGVENGNGLVQLSTGANNWATEPNELEQIFTEETFKFTTEATTHKFRQPEGEDYPQQSCLEGQSWNLDVHECVPIKYDPDIELDYTHLPGSPWSGVTRTPMRSHGVKTRKKLVIITDKRNITYIKTT